MQADVEFTLIVYGLKEKLWDHNDEDKGFNYKKQD